MIGEGMPKNELGFSIARVEPNGIPCSFHLLCLIFGRRAEADMRGPPPHRAAFARKADWFHMLARIRAKKDAAPVKVPHSEKPIPASRPETTLDELLSVGWTMPKARSTVAERLERAREERRSAGPLRLYLGSGQPK